MKSTRIAGNLAPRFVSGCRPRALMLPKLTLILLHELNKSRTRMAETLLDGRKYGFAVKALILAVFSREYILYGQISIFHRIISAQDLIRAP